MWSPTITRSCLKHLSRMRSSSRSIEIVHSCSHLGNLPRKCFTDLQITFIPLIIFSMELSKIEWNTFLSGRPKSKLLNHKIPNYSSFSKKTPSIWELIAVVLDRSKFKPLIVDDVTYKEKHFHANGERWKFHWVLQYMSTTCLLLRLLGTEYSISQTFEYPLYSKISTKIFERNSPRLHSTLVLLHPIALILGWPKGKNSCSQITKNIVFPSSWPQMIKRSVRNDQRSTGTLLKIKMMSQYHHSWIIHIVPTVSRWAISAAFPQVSQRDQSVNENSLDSNGAIRISRTQNTVENSYQRKWAWIGCRTCSQWGPAGTRRSAAYAAPLAPILLPSLQPRPEEAILCFENRKPRPHHLRSHQRWRRRPEPTHMRRSRAPRLVAPHHSEP